MVQIPDADVIVVGAGLVAAAEIADAGKRVLLLDQEGEQNLGGQAYWSLGGLFLVDSPEQRRLGIRDSRELAWSDWESTAGFDRPDDHWPRKSASSYVDFAAGEKRAWLTGLGLRFFPAVGWAERGGRGRRLRRQRNARLALAGGHFPGWLPLQRAGGRAGERGSPLRRIPVKQLCDSSLTRPDSESCASRGTCKAAKQRRKNGDGEERAGVLKGVRSA